MFMKLTPVVNFNNILRAAFVTIYFQQTITNPNCNQKKDSKNTFELHA